LLRFGVVAAIALTLSACGGGEQDTTNLLNRGMGTEPASLDVHKAMTGPATDVQRDLGEGLTGYDANGNLVLAAAERMQISEDGLEYTFWLRPNGRWSNGDPVTAADFVYSFRRLADPATAAFKAQALGDVSNAAAIISGDMPPEALGVEAVDPLQLKITLSLPIPYFKGLLTHPSTFPVHRASVEAHGNAHARPGNLISNGAYRLRDWRVGSFIEVERNEHYWNNERTSIDVVRHQVSPEPTAELNRYRAGELDTTASVPPEAFAQMREERPDELKVSPFLAVYYYGFNLSREPFKSNPKLRQALSMAIDREALTANVTGRGEAPAYGWVPPGTTNYEPRRFLYADMSKKQRQQTARQLYQESGYSDANPLEVEIRYNTSDVQKRVAETVQSMWQDVLGFKATLVNEELQVLIANVTAAEETEVFWLSWRGDYDDAHAFLSMLESDNPSNLVRYTNEEYDGLMEKAAVQTDAGLRKSYLEEAEKLMLADHPLIPLYFYVNKNMVSPRVQGWGDNVLNYHYSQHLSLSASD